MVFATMSLPLVVHSNEPQSHTIVNAINDALATTPAAAAATTSAASVPVQQLEKAVFRVQGMTCASCVNVIETYVGDLVGVDSIVVALLQECATVRFDPQKISVRSPRFAIAAVN